MTLRIGARALPALAACALVAAVVASGCGQGSRPPNLIVILADDLGAHDLPSYGHPYHRAPALDRLAAEGLRFTAAYAAAPVCAPTRAALLTGKSPARLHLTQALPPLGHPLEPMPAPETGPPWQRVTEPQTATALDPADATLAERLRALGYRTALIGKWHLGGGASAPTARGFDLVVGGGGEAAPASFLAPWGLAGLDAETVEADLTERLTAEAEAFLEQRDQRPFFLLLSHYAVHTPIQAEPARVEAWRRRLSVPEGDRMPGRDSLRPAYAAMVETLDESVGRILAKLGALGIDRDTVVVFTSDNGALYRTPDTGVEVAPDPALRGGKATLYEGGLRVPLLVRWPGRVAAGGVTAALTATTDWLPTLVELAGGSVADGGELDGSSLAPVLRDPATTAPRRTLHFFFPHYIPGYRHDPAVESYWNTPGAAVRSGDLKLVLRFGGRDELYDLATDPGETHDLAAERPEQAAALRAELERWLGSEGAWLPRPNVAYDPEAFARELAGATARLGEDTEWTPNGSCEQALVGGRLVIECEQAPFIVGPEMVVAGPLVVEASFRSSGTRGAPALWYRSVVKPGFSGDRVALAPRPDDASVMVGRIAATGTIRQLRLDFGRGRGGRAEIDWIRIRRDGEPRPLAEWSFEHAETRPAPGAAAAPDL